MGLVAVHSGLSCRNRHIPASQEATVTILALDPGITTGVAIRKDERTVRSDESGWPAAFVDSEYLALVVTEPTKLWDLVQTHKPSTIVIENFAAGGLISKDGQATIRLVGAMELAAYITGADLVLQFPSERRAFLDKARQMLVQRPTGRAPIVHEIDAMAHLLLYEHRLEHNIKMNRRSFATTTRVR